MAMNTWNLMPLLFLAIIAVVVILMVLTAVSHRRDGDADGFRICPDCRTRHPRFAAFCRQCGRRLT